MPQITRPQVYRVVQEMLPRERFGPDELLRWWRTSNYVTSGPDALMRNVAPPAAGKHQASLLNIVVVILEALTK